MSTTTEIMNDNGPADQGQNDEHQSLVNSKKKLNKEQQAVKVLEENAIIYKSIKGKFPNAPTQLLSHINTTPTFRAYYRNALKHPSDFATSLKDLIDNIILKLAKQSGIIKIKTWRESGRNSKIKISDNFVKGFENFHKDGAESPFNFIHMRGGHDDDDETSEFGEGMKLAAMLFGKNFTGYSRIDGNKYVKFEYDFLEMYEKDTFDGVKRSIISREEYKENHPYEYGTTLVFENLREHGINQNKDLDYSQLNNEIIRTYSQIIDARKITIEVNDHTINSDTINNAAVLLKKHITENTRANNRGFKFVIHRKNNGTDYRVSRKKVGGGGRGAYYKFNNNEQTFNSIDKAVFDASLTLWESDYTKLDYFVTSIAYAKELVDKLGTTELRGKTIITRNGRMMGETKNTCNPHPSQLYSVGYFEYTSKQLNKELGIGKDKQVNDITQSPLKIVLKSCMKTCYSDLSVTTIGNDFEDKHYLEFKPCGQCRTPEEKEDKED